MPPAPITALDGPLVVRCAFCPHEQTYEAPECFLSEFTAQPVRNEIGTIAVTAGLFAAVRLARVESRKILAGSARVKIAIDDSVQVARMILAKAKAKSTS